MFYLQDAIINIQDYIKKIKENDKVFLDKIEKYNHYFLAVGRLTKQKNYPYLINEFINYLKIKKDGILLIIGDGEEKNALIYI